MIQLCALCDRVFKEGDRVTLEVTSRYHIINSTRIFALDKNALEADSSTLKHESCDVREGD